MALGTGWLVTEEETRPGDKYVQYALRGLAVSEEQCRAIAMRPGQVTGPWPWRGVRCGIEVSWEEMKAIRTGQAPLDVLLPAVVIRELGRGELE